MANLNIRKPNLLKVLFLLLLFLGVYGYGGSFSGTNSLEYIYMLHEANINPPKYTIDEKSLELEEIELDESMLREFLFLNRIQPSLYDTLSPDDIVLIDKLINLGKIFWNIIESNKPVVNISLDYASATPEGISDWTALNGWKDVESKFYQFSGKNLYGIKVIDLLYGVSFAYGGQYKDKGRFLTNVVVIPAKVDVAWGFTLNMSADILKILNKGSSEDPVALMEVAVKYKIDTVLQHIERTDLFSFDGLGEFKRELAE